MRSNLSSSQKETEESSGGRLEAERKGKHRGKEKGKGKKGRVEGREGRRRETAQ